MFKQMMADIEMNKWSCCAPVILRVALGIIFLWHGYDKVFTKGISGITDFLSSLGFPLATFFAYVLSYGEIIAGILLILGLFTYIAAKYAAIVSFVAFFTVHLANGFSAADGGYEFIMLIFAAAVSIGLTGPGDYSLDAKRKKKQNMM